MIFEDEDDDEHEDDFSTSEFRFKRPGTGRPDEQDETEYPNASGEEE
jgi:hypothetical protein